MKTIGTISGLIACVIALHSPGLPLRAQSGRPPDAVPLSGEQHHHLVFENNYGRVFSVAVPPHDSTLLHQHEQDYVYVVYGRSEINNAVAGKPEARLQFQGGEIRFSRGPFAHIVKTLSDTPFRNVTIELLHKQGAARNLCGKVITGEPGTCSTPSGETAESRKGAGRHTANYTVDPWFETDGMQLDYVALGANRKFESVSRVDRLLVVLENAELEITSIGNKRFKLHPTDALWLSATTAVNIKNLMSNASRFVLISFKDSTAPSLR